MSLRIIALSLIYVLTLSGIQSVYSQEEFVPPAMFMGNSETIWRVDSDGSTEEIFSVLGQPLLSSSTLSEADQAFLESLNLNAPYNDTTLLFPTIAGFWSLPNDRLLIEVIHQICGMAADHRPCAGYAQFLLMNSDYTTRVLTTVDHHYAPAFDAWTCFWGDPQVTDMIINPTHDQAVIVFRMSHFNCDRSNSWGILVDFSSDEVSLHDFPLSYGFTWSPDGSYLAYLDLSECLAAENPRFCSGELRVRDRDGLREIIIPAQNNDHPAFSYDLVTWADENTLLYEQHVYNALVGDPSDVHQLVWYNIISDEAQITSLEFLGNYTALYRLTGEDESIIGITQAGEIVSFAPELPYRIINRLDGYRLAIFIPHNLNSQYFFVRENTSNNPIPGRDIYLMDANLQLFPVSIPEIFGDTWIYFMAVVR